MSDETRTPHPRKMEHYREIWHEMNRRKNDDYDRPTYKTFCPSDCCLEFVYVTTFEELDAVRKFEHLCEYCREHGGISKRMKQWLEACPKLFRDGDTKTKPERLKNLGQIAKHWTDKLPSSSLYIFGDTGAQKSRTTFYLLEQKTLNSRFSFRVLGGGDFRELLLSVMGDYQRVNDVKKALIEADLLVFDDFGQDALTDTMLADLWNIIDKRFCSDKRTIFLSNYSLPELTTRYGDQSNPQVRSMIRRIGELCKNFKF